MPAATIFIVDDDVLLRPSLRDRFDREGYDLIEAGSCAEATARLTPDVDLVRPISWMFTTASSRDASAA
jgi:DNA-binding NtrC family response regulator